MLGDVLEVVCNETNHFRIVRLICLRTHLPDVPSVSGSVFGAKYKRQFVMLYLKYLFMLEQPSVS